MQDFNAIDLARFQFAFTVGFHIVYPAFSIGLASYLATLNFLSLWTGDRVYLQLFDYWKRIFAIAFGMGLMLALTRAKPEERMATGLPLYRTAMTPAE